MTTTYLKIERKQNEINFVSQKKGRWRFLTEFHFPFEPNWEIFMAAVADDYKTIRQRLIITIESYCNDQR